MKNKFLLMAVVSALAAMVVIVPSVGAYTNTSEDAEISASVTSGNFIFQAMGSLSSGITISTVQAPATTITTKGVARANAGNYFRIYDYSNNTGANIKMVLSSTDADSTGETLGDFVYTGSAGTASSLNIPYANMRFAPRVDPADGVTPVTYTRGLDSASAYTINIIAASTSDLAEVSSTYSLNSYYKVGGYGQSLTATNSFSNGLSNYFRSTASVPAVVHVGLEKFMLKIPGKASAGLYTSTLYVLATDSSTY